MLGFVVYKSSNPYSDISDSKSYFHVASLINNWGLLESLMDFNKLYPENQQSKCF